jgi:LSD1 subclass zinc finger protein
MRRLRPEEVIKAYQKTGIMPSMGVTLGSYVSGNSSVRCACAIGVCFVAEGLQPPTDTPLLSFEAAKALGLTQSYSQGFIDGFDDCFEDIDATMGTEADTREYKTGQKDGRLCRQAVFKQ